MADGTETRLEEHLSGCMRITGQWFDVQVTPMRKMTYDVLLGMDILDTLGLTMKLNGARIFPPSHTCKGACATEGPLEARRAEKSGEVPKKPDGAPPRQQGRDTSHPARDPARGPYANQAEISTPQPSNPEDNRRRGR